MKHAGLFVGLVACLAVVGSCLPTLAAAPQGQSPVIYDVTLRDGGVMLGQVVDVQGAPKADVPVSLRLGEQEIATTATDANGYFAFSRLRGGVYQVVSAEGVGAYRAWAPGTAPPNAREGALVVAGQDLIRGNFGHHLGRLKFWLCNPWVVAAIVTTAVAVPVGIHNANRGGGPTSP